LVAERPRKQGLVVSEIQGLCTARSWLTSIRYRHFGEGAYDETEEKDKELLAERDRISGG